MPFCLSSNFYSSQGISLVLLYCKSLYNLPDSKWYLFWLFVERKTKGQCSENGAINFYALDLLYLMRPIYFMPNFLCACGRIQVQSYTSPRKDCLLFNIRLEALSRENRSDVQKNYFTLMTCYYLVSHLRTLKGDYKPGKELKGRLQAWKGALESKGLEVNVKKTRWMLCSENTGKFTKECEFPCAVCRWSVHSNSVICQFCRCWVHKTWYIRHVVASDIN